MTKFERAIDERFVANLRAEAEKGGWWTDVLADSGLFIALRGTYLNVYWRGQSLFRVEPTDSGLKVTTHEKFLIDPRLTSQIRLTNEVFEISNLIENGFIRQYDGKVTLEMMKRAASYFSGDEKRGCHEIAIRNSGVIDCEIAFPGFVLADDGTENRHGRGNCSPLAVHRPLAG